MYDNIGRIIKDLAQKVFIIEAIASVITGVALIVFGNIMTVLGILVMIVGSFLSWVSSCLFYGFGELIEKNCEIARNTDTILKSLETHEVNQNTKITEKYQNTNSSHRWLCNNCKKLRTQSPCEFCGKE